MSREEISILWDLEFSIMSASSRISIDKIVECGGVSAALLVYA